MAAKHKINTQESLFKFACLGRFDGGFIAGSKLPKERGNLKDFKIVRMTAIDGEDYTKFERRLIEKMKESPKRSAETRTRQLKSLIEKYTDKGKIFIIIINKAHLLNERMLLCFKNLHEMDLLKNVEKEGTYPGFVFLGDMDKFTELLNEVEGVKLRTMTF
jgi:hypothetical protein